MSLIAWFGHERSFFWLGQYEIVKDNPVLIDFHGEYLILKIIYVTQKCNSQAHACHNSITQL